MTPMSSTRKTRMLGLSAALANSGRREMERRSNHEWARMGTSGDGWGMVVGIPEMGGGDCNFWFFCFAVLGWGDAGNPCGGGGGRLLGRGLGLGWTLMVGFGRVVR